MKNMKNIRKGAAGEIFAASLLRNEGYRILARNYRTKFGEIDIIAEKNGCIHFVEVKTRAKNPNFSPIHAINNEKRRHIRNAAKIYLIKTHREKSFCAFDYMGIETEFIKGLF